MLGVAYPILAHIDEPTKPELVKMTDDRCSDHWEYLDRFIKIRNASIDPPPPDPRFEALVNWFRVNRWEDTRFDVLAKKIIDEIDKVKP